MRERTQVGIVGAGPAGLLLSHLLHLHGIDSIVVEARSRAYVENRVRAGVLEQGSVDILREAGLDTRLRREGLVHEGIQIQIGEHRHRLDLKELTGGKVITVYGQQEVVKDLIAQRLEDKGAILFEAENAAVHDFEDERARITFTRAGEQGEIACDFIAGCDGFHGICRPSIPQGSITVYDRVYPFAWLGILAKAEPASEEVIYVNHPRGFALSSMRSHEVARLYLQCRPDENLELWPDARIWEELHRRLRTAAGDTVHEGTVLEKGVTGMRSFVTEPMRHGRLFLAGDAAHIVPPTGAKGMNLAVADVRVLSEALSAFYRENRTDLLDGYSATCLQRVWRAEHFSWFMTSMLHKFPDEDGFGQKLQRSQLDYVVSSRAAAQSLAENYVGMPYVK
ncbi:MAG TPA: 4-hydroxybenzoate 3-monooxygenase [Beijerinckiaceae bacterium]|jgi:p-hydroxybenzoate 3-monooxygenase|nr:4-hydroxybenzoate 3-monooxygenase [Beijerinckiaceae bacterium]